MLAMARRLFEYGGSYVDECGPGRYVFHNPGFAAMCSELDTTQRSLVAVPAMAVGFEDICELFLQRAGGWSFGFEIGYRLLAKTTRGDSLMLCMGPRRQLEPLARQLHQAGLPALSPLNGFAKWLGVFD